MKWIRILPKTDVNVNGDFLLAINAGERKLCLVKYEGKLYATQRKCPHAGADLSNGWCKDGKLICPYHRYSYDLQTGRGSAGQADYVNVYPVETRNDGIYVGIPERFAFLKKLFRL